MEIAFYSNNIVNRPFQAIVEVTKNYALLRPHSHSSTPLCAYSLRDLTLSFRPLPVYAHDHDYWCTVRYQTDRVAWTEGSTDFLDLSTNERVTEDYSTAYLASSQGLGPGVHLSYSGRGSGFFTLHIGDRDTGYNIPRHKAENPQYCHPYYLVKAVEDWLRLLRVNEDGSFTTFDFDETASYCTTFEPPFFVFSASHVSKVYYLQGSEMVKLLSVKNAYIDLSFSEDEKGQKFVAILLRYIDRVELLTLNLP